MHVGILILMLSGCSLITVSLISTKWLYYCPQPTVCTHTGLLKTNEYCNSDSRCNDALQYGVFAMLCAAALCRAIMLYSAIDALYHGTLTRLSGYAVLMDGLLTMAALYTAFLVAHLKLNGSQSSATRDLRWPFYITFIGIFLAPLAFYIEPQNEDNTKYRNVR